MNFNEFSEMVNDIQNKIESYTNRFFSKEWIIAEEGLEQAEYYKGITPHVPVRDLNYKLPTNVIVEVDCGLSHTCVLPIHDCQWVPPKKLPYNLVGELTWHKPIKFRLVSYSIREEPDLTGFISQDELDSLLRGS